MIFLRPNEKIYLVKRRHRVVLMKALFPEFLIFLAAIIVIIFLFFVKFPPWPDWLVNFFPQFAEFNPLFILLFFLSIFLLVLWMVIFITFADYYFDCWIVTNERTIHTELKGLFSRVLASINHDKIQDISVEIQGILPTFFNFGDLHIQTAGEFREFVFKEIPDPKKTKEIIFQAQKESLTQTKKDDVF